VTWDEVLVYALGCLALEQSRDISIGRDRRVQLQIVGLMCISCAETADDRRVLRVSRSFFTC
jgi:hypothetical protein